MADIEGLTKAHELYEYLSAILNHRSYNPNTYRTLRSKLLEHVGAEALPSCVRIGWNVDEWRATLAIRSGGERAALKEDFAPLFESLESGAPSPPPVTTPKSGIDIFISHSTNDQALAAALQELFVFTLQIPPESIRISSVPGSRLKSGERFEDRLRKDISGCRVFIALVTPSLLRSYYSLFELGGRWELDILGDSFACEWKVLVARGAEKGKLPDPLKQRNALDLAQRDDAEQFLLDMQDVLQRKAGPANKYLTQVVEEASRIPPGFGGAGLSNKERVILRTLFDEEDGRYLSRYRDDDKYQKKIAALIDRELIRETGGKLKLTEKGAEVVREYLLSQLL